MVGNPIEMLYSSIGEFDGRSMLGIGNVYSKAFTFDQSILASRSPHVTMGNVWLPFNNYDAGIDEYLNLTKEVMCVNSIGENVLMRCSGSDFDSDSCLITNNPILVQAARRNYENFLVPTSMVEAKKVLRGYTYSEQTDLDIRTSVNKIGEIINLSQELNTMLWNRVNNGDTISGVMDLYYDIAKLDVMSGIEIDKAKREFDVDNEAEIKKLKQKYECRHKDGRVIKPNFFGSVARVKGYYDSDKKYYRFHDTTMDYLQHSINKRKIMRRQFDFEPFSTLLFLGGGYDSHYVNYSQIRRAISYVREMKAELYSIWSNRPDDMFDTFAQNRMSNEVRLKWHNKLSAINFNDHTAYRLLLEIEMHENKDIARKLFYALFSLPNRSFLDLVEQSRSPIKRLVSCDSGDIAIYGKRYSVF
jgi:hypothetical protein